MFGVNNLVGFGAGADKIIDPLQYIAGSAQHSSLITTVHPFSGKSLGDPALYRHIVAVIGTDEDIFSAISVTIRGVAATIHVQNARTAVTGHHEMVAIASAIVPAGETGDVVVSMPTAARCSLHLYRAVRSNATTTPVATDEYDTTDGTGMLNVGVNEYGVAAACENNDGVSALNWPDAIEDNEITTNNLWLSCAHFGEQTSVYFTASGITKVPLAAVSWNY